MVPLMVAWSITVAFAVGVVQTKTRTARLLAASLVVIPVSVVLTVVVTVFELAQPSGLAELP